MWERIFSQNFMLADKIRMSSYWRQCFFPMQKALRVRDGDTISYKIKVIPQGNEVFWQWEVSIYRSETKIEGFSARDIAKVHKNLRILVSKDLL